MKEESWICVNTYNSLNKIDGVGSFWLFSFGAKRMFLSYEMSENSDWAGDDEHLLFLRCWQGKEKKCICISVVFMSLPFVNKAHLLKKKNTENLRVFVLVFSFCSRFMLKFSRAYAK